jgi:hypothetical protein
MYGRSWNRKTEKYWINPLTRHILSKRAMLKIIAMRRTLALTTPTSY